MDEWVRKCISRAYSACSNIYMTLFSRQTGASLSVCLPSELLEVIVLKIDNPLDVIRLRAVCKGFRDACECESVLENLKLESLELTAHKFERGAIDLFVRCARAGNVYANYLCGMVSHTN